MRRRNCVLIFVSAALVAVGVGVWTARSGGDVPLSPRAAAERLVEQCEWRAARDACTALLVASPDDGEILQWRGRCHLALGRLDEALADFTRAVAEAPRDAETLYYRSMVHRRLGHQDLADADFTAARAIDPHQNKLLAAMRADQADSNLRSAERAAARRVQDQATRRASPQADRVEAIASAARRASAAASVETEHASEATPSNNSPFGDRPTLADLWSNDDGEIADSEVASSWTRTASFTEGAPDAERNGTPYGRDELPRGRHRTFARWDQPGGTAAPHAKPDEPPAVDGRRVNLPDSQHPRPQPAMTAWERFRQDQAEAQRRSRLELPLQQRSYDRASDEPTSGSSRRQGTSDLAVATPPSGKYPIRAISVYDATQPSGLLQASRAHAVTATAPSSAAGSRFGSRVPRREPAAAPLSTAMIQLPEAATDMSAAAAAFRPGVLSTAVYELLTPPEPPKDVPLTTQSAPLPDWIAAPSFAAPR